MEPCRTSYCFKCPNLPVRPTVLEKATDSVNALPSLLRLANSQTFKKSNSTSVLLVGSRLITNIRKMNQRSTPDWKSTVTCWKYEGRNNARGQGNALAHQYLREPYEVSMSFNSQPEQGVTGLRTEGTAGVPHTPFYQPQLRTPIKRHKNRMALCPPHSILVTHLTLQPVSLSIPRHLSSSNLFLLIPTSRSTRGGQPTAGLTLRGQNIVGDRMYSLEQVTSWRQRTPFICIRWGRLQYPTDDACPPTSYHCSMETA